MKQDNSDNLCAGSSAEAGLLSTQEGSRSAREASGLPEQTLLCVWLPWLSSVCFVPLPPSAFPSSLPLYRPL